MRYKKELSNKQTTTRKEPPRIPVTFTKNDGDLKQFIKKRAAQLHKSEAVYLKDLAREDLARASKEDEALEHIKNVVLFGYDDTLLPTKK